MGKFLIHKGAGKEWEFKGICPLFCWVGIGVLTFLTIVFLSLLFAIGIFTAAIVLVLLGSVATYALLTLNKTFGQHGFFRFLAERKLYKTLVNNLKIK